MKPTLPALPGFLYCFPFSIFTLPLYYIIKKSLEWGKPGKSGKSGRRIFPLPGLSFFVHKKRRQAFSYLSIFGSD